MTSPILVIIPARKNSKTVARKNMQIVAGKTLVARTIETVLASGIAARVMVSTDDPEVAAVAATYDVEVHARPEHLAGDEVPLWDVVTHVVETEGWDGLVVVCQPTCPLLTPFTLRSFVADFRGGHRFDWAIAGSEDRHMFWRGGGPLTPRVNRQFIPDPLMRESGAIAIYTPAAARNKDAAGVVLPIPVREALDIDTWDDLEIARRALTEKRILFKVAVGKNVGTGHLFRSLRVAELLGRHQVAFRLPQDAPVWAMSLVRERGFDLTGPAYEFKWPNPELVIFDMLDTDTTQVCAWKSIGVPVVTFEDEGSGARYADLVINELLPPVGNLYPHMLYGPRYSVLRPEFLNIGRGSFPSGGASKLLVAFGGSDPAGLNQRFSAELEFGADVRILVGPAADPDGCYGEIVTGNVAEHMRWADLLVTAQGRMVTEAAAVGLPTISVAVNERESRHARIPGVLYLGLHHLVAPNAVLNLVGSLTAVDLAEMSRTAAAQVDGAGADRIVARLEMLLGGLL